MIQHRLIVLQQSIAAGSVLVAVIETNPGGSGHLPPLVAKPEALESAEGQISAEGRVLCDSDPMDPALAGLIGSLGGTALGWLLSTMTEVRRYRREEATRWQSDRRELYAKFHADAMDCYMAFDPFRSEPVPEPVERRVHLSSREISLLASDPVEASADAVWDALSRLRQLKLRGINKDDFTEVEMHGEAKAAFYDALEDFVRAAKQELGISSSRRRPPYVPLSRLYRVPFAFWGAVAKRDIPAEEFYGVKDHVATSSRVDGPPTSG